MSLTYLKSVFNALEQLDSISVQVLRVTNAKDGSHYYARQIEIQPEEDLIEFISGFRDHYSRTIDTVSSLDDYQGDIVNGNYYKLPLTDDLICTDYQVLVNTLSNPSVEGNIAKKSWTALVIKGVIQIDDNESPVMLFSMKSPVTAFRNKFIMSGKDKFRKVSEPILTLNKNLDAIIINGFLYMLTMQAENLFNMERSYKLRCGEKVEEIVNLGILTNNDVFKNIATKGQNPRKFVSFNQSRLDALKETNSRKKYMKMFQIDMKDEKIDTEANKSTERLVKFLCNKAMLDPVDEGPREVSAAKAWL